MPASDPDVTLIDTLETLLIEGGPATVSQLMQATRAAGHDLDDEDWLREELYDGAGDDFFPLGDDRWTYLPGLLNGRVVTHRLTAEEVDADVLTANPDFAPLLLLSDDVPLLNVGGAPLTVVLPARLTSEEPEEDDPSDDAVDELGSYRLPPGTLTDLGVDEGELVALSVTEEGVLLSAVDSAELQSEAAGVRDWLTAVASGDGPVETAGALPTLMADCDDAFRAPTLPLGELFEDANLVQRGDWVAPVGFDFNAYWANQRTDRVVERYELDRDDAEVVAAYASIVEHLSGVVATVRSSEHPEHVRDETISSVLAFQLQTTPLALPARLASPSAADALLRESVEDHDDSGAEALVLLTDALTPQAGRAVQPALGWLRAKAYEHLGRVTDAELALRAAERADPDWPLTLLELAHYASDRGDASRAVPAHPRRALRRPRPAGAADAVRLRTCSGRRAQRALLVRVRPQVQAMPPAPAPDTTAGRAGGLALPRGGPLRQRRPVVR